MKTLLLSALLLGLAPAPAVETASRDLKLLYVADGTSSERAAAFERFLEERFGAVTVTDHERYDRAMSRAADVVLFDWSMDKGDMPPATSPLGKRGEWDRPTVFLATAGLHHSCAWEVAGGSG